MIKQARRYRRHERFSLAVAADPELQRSIERSAEAERDFILDCLDLIEGRQTPGAARAMAERDRLQHLSREAKRRALVGADPLNITGHTKGKQPKRMLGADPIEYVGQMARTLSGVDRLTGKNKLGRQQVLAAETYRMAFETMHATLGGAMDFDRVRGGSGGSKSPPEAVLAASETLRHARAVLGIQATVIVEQIVCHGHTAEATARLVCGYLEGQKVKARDANYVGRIVREGLTQLGLRWHPNPSRQPMRTWRPADSEVAAGETGLCTVLGEPYVSR
jgi:hypothetical protein